MREVGKVLGRSKAFSLKMISARLGKIPLSDVNREKIGKARAKEGAGPVTVGIEVGYMGTLFTHGATVHGMPFSAESVFLGRKEIAALIKICEDAPPYNFPSASD